MGNSRKAGHIPCHFQWRLLFAENMLVYQISIKFLKNSDLRVEQRMQDGQTDKLRSNQIGVIKAWSVPSFLGVVHKLNMPLDHKWCGG